MDQYLKGFIKNLRCPITGFTLRNMQAEELDKLNISIQDGVLRNHGGKELNEAVKEALINEDESYVYPVLDGYIAVLLPDKAISLKGEAVLSASLSAADKKKVQDFYDEYGWQKSGSSNSYKDTVAFEDHRPVSQKYWSRCHMRLNKYLPGGDYLLDVACGAIPNDEYLSYTQNYKLRICMDFSILAVKEAAVRLGGKGIFILGDMTSIPVADNCIDAVISMHTVYHIPVEEQTSAVAEVYRVLKPESQAVIVYSWKKAPLMRLAFNVWNPVIGFYKKIKRKPTKRRNHQTEVPPNLFVQQQNYDWFKQQIKEQYHAKLEVYSAISRSFSRTFLRKKMFGSKVSAFIYGLENRMPSLLGKYGQYPVFLLRKEKLPA